MDTCKPYLLYSDEHEVNDPFKISLKDLLKKATLFAAADAALIKLHPNNSPLKPEVLYPQKNMPRKTGLDNQSHVKAIGQTKKNPVITYAEINMNTLNLSFDKDKQYCFITPCIFNLQHVIQETIANIMKFGFNLHHEAKFIISS